jgi:protein-disulfide isomerase
MNISRILLSGIAITLLHSSAFAQAATPATPATINPKDIEPIVREYILKHPEVIMESISNFQKNKEAAEQKDQINFLNAHKKEIFDDAGTAYVGAKDAKHVIVEFFDYNCGACKAMFPALDQLIREDKNLKVIFKEFPIFGDRSVALSRIGHAVYRLAPEKYLAFHEKMMSYEGHTSETEALQFANQLGLDVSLVKKEAAKKEILAQIQNDRKIAGGIGANGTPTLIVNGQIVGHALDLDGLKERLSGVVPAEAPENPEDNAE